jgi:hypothetical protein
VRNLYYIAFCLFLFANTSLRAQFYSGTAQDFSVSKLNYKTHEWRHFDLAKFRVHFYGFDGAEEMAEKLAYVADSSLRRIQTYFDTRIDNPIDIVLFSSYYDYLHSNIGTNTLRELNIGGTAPVDRSRVVIYATGKNDELIRQLNEGIAGVIINNIFFGGNWKDALKNNTLLDLPSWYIEGLKSYLATDWINTIDNHVRVGILSGKYQKIGRLKGNDAKYAGHALWKFIADTNGDNVIPNIVYLARISANIESGFAYVIGSNIPKLLADYNNYYSRRYGNEAFVNNPIEAEKVDVKLNKRETLLSFLMSPDEKYAAAVYRKEGKFKVELLNLQKKSSKKVFSSGYEYVHYQDAFAPVLAWHPSSQTVALMYNKKQEVILELVDVNGKSDKKQLPEIDAVVSANYSPDGREMAISAIRGAQSDIYLYTALGNNMINLTTDTHADLYPSFSLDGNTILFSSDRSGGKTNDIYEISKQGSNLTQVTFTPNVNDLMPMVYGKEVTFIADNNGIYNRYYARKDSSILAVDTVVHYSYFTVITPISNLPYSINNYQALNNSRYAVQMATKNGVEFYIFDKSKDKSFTKEELLNTAHINLLLNPIKVKRVGDKKQSTVTTNSDGKITYEKEVVNLSESETKQKQKATSPSVRPAIIKLTIPSPKFNSKELTLTQISTQLDNSFLTPNYQYFNQNGYYNPGFNTTLFATMQDLFDDYSIQAAIRLPFNFDSNEVLFRFENKKRKIKKGAEVFRSSIYENILYPNSKEYLSRTHMYEFNTFVSKPLNLISEVKLQGGIRHQSQATLGQVFQNNVFPDQTLDIPTKLDYMGVLRAFYVLNNSYSPETNTRYGFRMKLFGELFNDLRTFSSRTMALGTDIRHYQKIHKGIVWANRLSFSTSFGSQKILYYLGGVDNWFFPKFDKNIARPEDGSYLFQTIATPMRGFIQNARNGSSFAVINSEFRVPLFRYFSPEPLRSDFLNNFQIIGFGDVGSAWTGANPYDNTNAFNVKIVEEKNILVKIQNNQEPLVYGYGFGVRSKLFGYYIRVDWAWGIDDGKPTNARYVSLSLDF